MKTTASKIVQILKYSGVLYRCDLEFIVNIDDGPRYALLVVLDPVYTNFMKELLKLKDVEYLHSDNGHFSYFSLLI